MSRILQLAQSTQFPCRRRVGGS